MQSKGDHRGEAAKPTGKQPSPGGNQQWPNGSLIQEKPDVIRKPWLQAAPPTPELSAHKQVAAAQPKVTRMPLEASQLGKLNEENAALVEKAEAEDQAIKARRKARRAERERARAQREQQDGDQSGSASSKEPGEEAAQPVAVSDAPTNTERSYTPPLPAPGQPLPAPTLVDQVGQVNAVNQFFVVTTDENGTQQLQSLGSAQPVPSIELAAAVASISSSEPQHDLIENMSRGSVVLTYKDLLDNIHAEEEVGTTSSE